MPRTRNKVRSKTQPCVSSPDKITPRNNDSTDGYKGTRQMRPRRTAGDFPLSEGTRPRRPRRTAEDFPLSEGTSPRRPRRTAGDFPLSEGTRQRRPRRTAGDLDFPLSEGTRQRRPRRTAGDFPLSEGTTEKEKKALHSDQLASGEIKDPNAKLLHQATVPGVDVRSVTFVTGLYDIGRADWKHYTRNMTDYLTYFSHLLTLKVMLYVFCEGEVAEFVRQNRNSEDTVIHEVPFKDVECYKFRQSIQRVMRSKTFRKNNTLLNHPECFSADYVIITNSKVSFLKTATERNPFGTSHFVWIDAGYGHGTGIYPGNGQWLPAKLLGMNRKITFIQLRDIGVDDDNDLHKGKEPVLNGGFFGGDKWAIEEYYRTYRDVFCACLNKNVVDDDQSIALYTYFRYPSLFEFVRGDWYDAIKLYS